MPTLEITTTLGCPLDCTFCPQDTLKAAYAAGEARRLPLNDFVTIIDKLPKYVRIDFSGMSEPWLNTDCTAMLRYALEQGHHVALYTTLVGMNDANEVIGLLNLWRPQVEVVVIHLPDRLGNMRGFKSTPRYRQALKLFVELGRAGKVREFRLMSMGAPVDPLHPIDQILDWEGCDRAGSLERANIEEQAVVDAMHPTPVGCSYTPFYDQNVLLPNGDVVLCCMDYGLKHVIGNLLTGDYASLFTSPEMNALRTANMGYGCDGSICKSCNRAVAYGLGDYHQYWGALS